MSLTRYVKRPEVRDKIKPLRPPPPRKIPAPIRAEPRSSRQNSSRQTVVGVAFDYLIRFELQRRAPHATARQWVAETAAEMLERGERVLTEVDWSGEWTGGSEVRASPREVVDAAKAAVASHLKAEAPDWRHLAGIAAHAIRLAKLDSVVRALAFNPGFVGADFADVEDLLDMLEIVPWDSLVRDETLMLNPILGESSRMIGGADADLISGDLLVDFKTTTKQAMNPTELDQLFGYFLLARNERKADPDFPEIRRVGLYFCRHGHLSTWDVSQWTGHPEFLSIEDWFFNHAKSLRSPPKPPLP